MSQSLRNRSPGKPTSLTIAHLAGVSQPTVSRALRGSPMVNAETRKRIEAIAQQLRYSVDRNASNLRSRETRTLALLIFEDPTSDDSLINPFFHSMLGSITRACAERRYDLLVSFQPRSNDSAGDFGCEHKADGIILLGYGDYHDHRARTESLAASGTHFVRWGQVQDGQPGRSIGCDNFRGGYEATRHLLGCGRRHIAFLGNATSHYPEFLERFRGYRLALEEAGVAPPEPLQIDALSTESSGHDAACRLLADGRTFDAAVAASDLIAIGAMRAWKERSIRVPEQVSVVGFDDLPAASLASPALTTIMQDTRLAGVVLVDTLMKLIRGEPAEDRMLPARLIVRQSCGAVQAGVSPAG
ncbi:MAG: substrate-binding domain-containing protein [Gammaproteobacteria bacterium]|nr:substrate-binding domain-containing protein [Gammaproteobacteria bacterium]